MNPANDGAVIRLVMPQLTEERRREYIKVAAQGGGPHRVRNVRRHAVGIIKKLEKEKEIGEDGA